MAGVAKRLGRLIEREIPAWGISPVPAEHRRLSGLDLGVLWWDLSIGLLVLATGALLVPSLGLPRALLAILIGSVIGCLPLALVGVAGASEGVPTMVLFRPVLGIRGSYLPSILNLIQLLGWTAFEFWAMATVANEVSRRLFGFDGYLVWLAAVAILCTGLALAGPMFVVHRWLERFGVYVLVAVGAFITYKVLVAGTTSLRSLWHAPGEGGLPFWLAVDLVVAQPISWLPLVADYNRFARPNTTSFAGTYWGYLLGNAWFYALGALLVLAAGASADIGGIGSAVAALAGGTLLLLLLLAGETHEAFADIYSWAVSAQNIAPDASQRWLMIGVAAASVALASLLTMATYQFFLYLVGSVFVPLFGVFAADYFLLRRGRSDAVGSVDPGGHYRGVNWRAVAPWVVGFVLYQWSVPTSLGWWTDGMRTLFHGWLHLSFPLLGSALGASVPSFLVAFVLAAILLPSGRRAPGPSNEP